MLLEQLNTTVFVHHSTFNVQRSLHHRTTATEATAKAAASEAATATATAAAEAARTTLTATATATATTAEATSKEVQTIDDVQHCIAGNGIILRITALHGVEDTANGRLLMQDIVELQRDGQCITPQERLRQLCIPNQFVGIHRCIAITTTALHIDIRSQLRTPRSRDTRHGTIRELPCIEVVVRLQFTA